MWTWLKDVLYVIGAILGIVGIVWTVTVYFLKAQFATKDEIKGIMTRKDVLEHCSTNRSICHQQICGKIDSLTKLVEGHIALDAQKASRMDQRNIWIVRMVQSIADSLNEMNKDGRQVNITDMPV